MRRFGFADDTYVRLSAASSRPATLPVDTPVSLERLLAHHVELQHPATRKQIATLAEHTKCPNTKPRLEALAADDTDASAYRTEVKRKRRSVLDLLDENPACELPFEVFLDMLPAMTPRYYSISSSPLAEPDRCSITVGVVREPAWSGLGTFEGVASTYLERHAGEQMIDAFVKDSKSGFRLPDDPSKPILMIGPGTGLAPFRGFLQEREALKRDGKMLGRAMLFFGCRHPDQDYLYREELERWAADGIVELHVAFSRLGEAKRYVQHDIAEHADDVWSVLDGDGVVYVCGDGSRMEPDVRATLIDLYRRKIGRGRSRPRTAGSKRSLRTNGTIWMSGDRPDPMSPLSMSKGAARSFGSLTVAIAVIALLLVRPFSWASRRRYDIGRRSGGLVRADCIGLGSPGTSEKRSAPIVNSLVSCRFGTPSRDKAADISIASAA